MNNEQCGVKECINLLQVFLLLEFCSLFCRARLVDVGSYNSHASTNLLFREISLAVNFFEL